MVPQLPEWSSGDPTGASSLLSPCRRVPRRRRIPPPAERHAHLRRHPPNWWRLDDLPTSVGMELEHLDHPIVVIRMGGGNLYDHLPRYWLIQSNFSTWHIWNQNNTYGSKWKNSKNQMVNDPLNAPYVLYKDGTGIFRNWNTRWLQHPLLIVEGHLGPIMVWALATFEDLYLEHNHRCLMRRWLLEMRFNHQKCLKFV